MSESPRRPTIEPGGMPGSSWSAKRKWERSWNWKGRPSGKLAGGPCDGRLPRWLLLSSGDFERLASDIGVAEPLW